jgi:hypothetical protein
LSSWSVFTLDLSLCGCPRRNDHSLRAARALTTRELSEIVLRALQGNDYSGWPTTHPGMNQSFTQATEITPAPLDQSARVIRSNTAQEARNSSRSPVPPRISRTCKANPALGQRMLGAGPHIPKAGPALHHAPYFRQANQRIGQEPRGDAGQRADDRELGSSRRHLPMEQKRNSDQHRRMNDVDRIGASPEPLPGG